MFTCKVMLVIHIHDSGYDTNMKVSAICDSAYNLYINNSVLSPNSISSGRMLTTIYLPYLYFVLSQIIRNAGKKYCPFLRVLKRGFLNISPVWDYRFGIYYDRWSTYGRSNLKINIHVDVISSDRILFESILSESYYCLRVRDSYCYGLSAVY